jgi:hypothetical protein
MRRFTLVSFLALAVSLIPWAAHAQGTSTATVSGAVSSRGHGIGIGAVQMLDSDRTNLMLTYGELKGRFHIDGLLGMSRNIDNSDSDNTRVNFGARFWYHLHAATYADFSMGGGLLVDTFRTNDRFTDFLFDIGAQIRIFIVPNVAMLGTVGLGLNFRDGASDQLMIGGKTLGSVGIAYFFE